MPSTKTAPYGSWKSPITSDLIVEQTTVLSEMRLAGNDIYWLEGRPREQGRNVVVRASPHGDPIDITPAAFNARARVHEYGGASWLVAGGTRIVSNFADQRLYLQRAGQSPPEPLTPAPLDPKHHFRYGDGVLDEGRRRWIGVREVSIASDKRRTEASDCKAARWRGCGAGASCGTVTSEGWSGSGVDPLSRRCAIKLDQPVHFRHVFVLCNRNRRLKRIRPQRRTANE
jgi:hypothetical protein